MSQQIINIGAASNDGTGDPLRVSFDKSNQNFTELYGAGIGFQPLDADLTAIAALTGTNDIYYRSGTDTWSSVAIGAGLNFASGTLTNTGGSGGAAEYVFNTNTSAPPNSGQIRLNNTTQSLATIIWVHNITNGGVDLKRALETTPIGAKLIIQDKDDSSKYANYQVSGALVDGDTYWEIPVTFLVGGSALANQQRIMLSIQTGASYAPLASPAFTGNPVAPTPTAGDNDTSIATTAFVTTAITGKADTSALAAKADLASPTFTGDPKAPTPATADNDTSIATTAYVQAQGYLTSAAAAAAYQPLDADLTAIAALTGTNTIYYRSASNTWTAVNVSTGLAFSGGNLTATGAGGNVGNSGTPTAGQIAQWTDATHIKGVTGVPGTATNDSAAAGYVGECMEQTRSYSSPLSVPSTGVTFNLTASPLALTAGDWDISANLNFVITTSTAITSVVMSISTVSLTFNNVAGFRAETCVPNTGATLSCTLPPVRVSLAGSQNYYLVAIATYSATSIAAYGIIHARRVR